MKKILYFITTQNKDGINLALENQDDEVTILLIQNAVYLATKTCTEVSEALKQNKKIIALKNDIKLRGLEGQLLEGIIQKDYNEYIDIVFQQDTIINY